MIDFGAMILDLQNQPIKEPKNSQPITLSDACIAALLHVQREEGYDEKAKKFKLAQKISLAKEPIEVSLVEKELIKKCVTEIYGPLVLGRVCESLFGQV